MNAWNLINNLGGLQLCTKITFSKRVHKYDAKYFIQNPENKNQVQFFLEDEVRPENAMSIVDLEDAIQEVTGVFSHQPTPLSVRQ